MKTIEITNLYGGISPTLNYGTEGSYLGAVAIDPDEKVGGRIAGTISPVAYKELDTIKDIMWLLPNDINTDTYFYAKGGEFGKVDKDGVVTTITTLTNASGNGLSYYNNYYYIAKDTEVVRYGPIDGAPAIQDDWAGTLYNYTRQTSADAYAEPAGLYSGKMWTNPYNACKDDETESIAENTKYTIWKDFKVKYTIFSKIALKDTIPVGATIKGFEVSIDARFNSCPEGSEMKIFVELTKDGLNPIGGIRSTGVLTQGLQRFIVGGQEDLWNNTFDRDDLGSNFGVMLSGNVSSSPITADFVVRYIQVRVFYSTETSKSRAFLNNPTLSKVGNYNLPNHSMYIHGNNALYVADSIGGRGTIHRINAYDYLEVEESAQYADLDMNKFIMGEVLTGEYSLATGVITGVVDRRVGGARERAVLLTDVEGTFEVGEIISGTTEGEGKVKSALKKGYQGEVLRNEITFRDSNLITSIEGYGSDVSIGSVGNINSCVSFWDSMSPTLYRNIPMTLPVISSLKNVDGTLHIIGGNSDSLIIGRYLGGDTIEEVVNCENGLPPLGGAVIVNENRLLMGSSQDYPSSNGCLWSFGTKVPTERKLHSIASVAKQITGLGRIGDIIIGSEDGLFKKSDEGFNSVWVSRMFNFSQPFTIQKITIPLSDTLSKPGENDDPDKITAVNIGIHYDNDRVSDTHEVVLDSDSRSFTIYPVIQGTTNFYIKLSIVGDKFVSIGLPIRITYEINE